MLKKATLVLLLLVVLIFVSSCGSAEHEAAVSTETPVTTPIETPKPVEPTPTEKPLFNKDFVVPDSSVRPVAAMIDNQGDRPLPQGGISQAQIIYEILVEYNITRYIAFFWGTMPDMIGPVRSSRHYFLDYAMEYDAVYTHAGGSPYALKDISKFKIQNIDYQVHSKAFWDLTKDIRNWQDSYTSRERVEQHIKDYKYRTEPQKPFPFQYYDYLTVPEEGQNAKDISIRFVSKGGSFCGYNFDAATNTYLRTRMGKPHMERNTGEQVRVTNILVQEIESPLIPGDKEGRRNLKNIGKGNGWYITGGKAIPIKWAKDARDAQTTYTTEDGKPVVLNRGQTWIEIVHTLEYVEFK